VIRGAQSDHAAGRGSDPSAGRSFRWRQCLEPWPSWPSASPAASKGPQLVMKIRRGALWLRLELTLIGYWGRATNCRLLGVKRPHDPRWLDWPVRVHF
jgi:hypothetical protein